LKPCNSPFEELQKRQRVRSSLAEFARATGKEPAAHHLYIMKYLEQISGGELHRLLIACPPGSAKSEICSVWMPAWYLANHPANHVLCCSHTQELSERFARRVRNLVDEYSAQLGIALSPDSQAGGRWSLTAGGSLFALGVTGAITGYRADLVLVDDPFPNREDALNENNRRKVYDWMIGDVMPRLRPGAAVVVISTRFHTDDLFGRLEATGKYKTIVLPAVASEHDEIGRAAGDWLWDTDPNYPYGQFPRDQFEIQPPEIWASLFLQNPVVEGGNFFKDEWIKHYHQIPDRRTMHIYGASDYALTDGGGDFTVHVVVGLTPENDLYLLDMWRRQADSATSVDAFLDLVREWRPLGWSSESGQIRAALGPYIKLRQRQCNIYVGTETFPTKGDKAIRAQSIRGRMATGGLFVPRHAEFLPVLKSELLLFPAGKHDDIVDALGLIGQILDKMSPGRPLEPEKPRPKVLSFEPGKTTLTLTELFEENERRYKGSSYRRI